MVEVRDTVPLPPEASWLPPGMPDVDKATYLEAYPTDPHRAAAEAWESWAAQAAAAPAIQSVSTGSQSVSYAAAVSEYEQANRRAAWHRSRARARSVEVGPTLTWGYLGPDEASVSEEIPNPVGPVPLQGGDGF